MHQGLTVGDGFKFGCGFILASVIAGIVVSVVGTLLSVLFSAALAGLFSGMLGTSDWVGMLPALFGVF